MGEYVPPIEPPAWVMQAPAPAETVIKIVHNQKLQELCRIYTPGWVLGGCTIPEPAVCRIYLNEKYQREPVKMRAILRHERGHCHGWAANHPETK